MKEHLTYLDGQLSSCAGTFSTSLFGTLGSERLGPVEHDPLLLELLVLGALVS